MSEKCPLNTVYVLNTSEAGDKLAQLPNITFKPGKAEGDRVCVFPEKCKQQLHGIGTSFTEASAFVLAHLTEDQRAEVMENIYGQTGANFSMARTPVGATDFCVHGKYSYNDTPYDLTLKTFSIECDKDGFCQDTYTGIKDSHYDLLPMIKQAQQIKKSQQQNDIKIVASAWTAPCWMKNINDWYLAPAPDNNHQGTGGCLKPEYESVYAAYLIKYLEAYKREGINIWGLTPVNEPEGNNGQWESMHFSPQSQAEFIKKHLGPKLSKSGNDAIKLLIYDQNRDILERWADVIYNDQEAAGYVYGAAVHWYESTFKVFEEVLESVHNKYPDYQIIHTEGCIDDLGNDAPDGALDPAGFKEKNWFKNDSFWWQQNATDWAYSVTWPGVDTAAHPMYVPVHRYARNIIVSLNHWVTGWIDWNIVLDKRGGPNHVGNYCGAPIMIDTCTGEVYYTPVYYVLSQLSRTIRPGDYVVNTELTNKAVNHLYVLSTINQNNLLNIQVLNTDNSAASFNLQIQGQHAEVQIEPNALQTIGIQL